jgi:hypothetical protein
MQIPKQEINKRIKHVVALSKEIPFYARKYKELGINPDEIKTPQDLLKAYEKGLYTTPQDLPELVYYKDEMKIQKNFILLELPADLNELV